MNLVVAGQLGSGPGAGHRVGAFGGGGEHVGEVGVGAAGQGDVRVLAVLGPGDHRQAGVHRAALGDMIGDRVPQFGIAEILVQESAVGPPPRPGMRVGVQGAPHDQPGRGDGLDPQQVAVGQRPPGFSCFEPVVVAGAGDQVAGAGRGAIGDADRRSGLDDAQGDEVIADAAGQLAAQRMLGRHEQGVGAVGGQGDVGGRGGVHHLLGVSAEDAAVLVVVGQHGGVAVAQPQAGVLFPGGAEPGRFGEPGVAEGVGEQGHAAAVLDGLQLAGVPGQDHLPVAGLGVGDQVGQVRAGHRGGLVDQQQRPRAGLDRAAGAAPARQVAQELGAVVRDRDPGGQGVAGRLRRGDPDYLAQAGRGPRFAAFGQDVGLAGPGRRIDHRDALAVGQDRHGRGGLILAQPGPRARRVRVWRVAGQRGVELCRVGAEGARGLRAGQTRRAARAGLREHAFFHDQLRAGGEPGAAVALIDAAPVGAQQAARNFGWLGCFQADHWLELRGQRPVGQVLQQRGGRGGVHSGAGQDPAQVLDHIRAGPGALFLLRQGNRLLRRARQLELGEDRAVCAVRVRGAAGCAVPDRWRDRRQAHAERARELVRPSPRAAARHPARRASGCAS